MRVLSSPPPDSALYQLIYQWVSATAPHLDAELVTDLFIIHFLPEEFWRLDQNSPLYRDVEMYISSHRDLLKATNWNELLSLNYVVRLIARLESGDSIQQAMQASAQGLAACTGKQQTSSSDVGLLNMIHMGTKAGKGHVPLQIRKRISLKPLTAEVLATFNALTAGFSLEKPKVPGELGSGFHSLTYRQRIDRNTAWGRMAPWLVSPELFAYRIATGVPSIRRYVEPESDIIALLDVSASMNDQDKTAFSAAVAYALARTASSWGRRYIQIMFDEEVVAVAEGAAAVQLALSVERSGGTKIDAAASKAAEIAKLIHHKPIAIIISDGEVEYTKEVLTELAKRTYLHYACISCSRTQFVQDIERLGAQFLAVTKDRNGVLKIVSETKKKSVRI